MRLAFKAIVAKTATIPPIPRTNGMTAELSARFEDCEVDEEASVAWVGGTAEVDVVLLVGDSVEIASAVGWRLVGASLGSSTSGVGKMTLLSVVGMLSIGAWKVPSFVGPGVAGALAVCSAVGICVAGRTFVAIVGTLVGARVGF